MTIVGIIWLIVAAVLLDEIERAPDLPWHGIQNWRPICRRLTSCISSSA
jgi:hypothetical protein